MKKEKLVKILLSVNAQVRGLLALLRLDTCYALLCLGYFIRIFFSGTPLARKIWPNWVQIRNCFSRFPAKSAGEKNSKFVSRGDPIFCILRFFANNFFLKGPLFIPKNHMLDYFLWRNFRVLWKKIFWPLPLPPAAHEGAILSFFGRRCTLTTPGGLWVN